MAFKLAALHARSMCKFSARKFCVKVHRYTALRFAFLLPDQCAYCARRINFRFGGGCLSKLNGAFDTVACSLCIGFAELMDSKVSSVRAVRGYGDAFLKCHLHKLRAKFEL